ncbi:MAG TPA: DUF92 domain-containing protein [Cytophagaceae bacterium]
MSQYLLPVLAQLFSIVVGLVSYHKKAISTSGLIALLLISSLFIWSGEIGLLFTLFYMFASSSLLTKYKKSLKGEFDIVVGKTGPRDYKQALCNLGVATAGLLFYLYFQHEALIAAIISSVAAANADSWASEIGGLSKKQPVMITNFKPVNKGISGGVTLMGMAGGVAGSLFIVIAGVTTIQAISPFKGNLFLLCWTTALAGIIGFLFDSYLGALAQALYKNSTTNELTEYTSGKMELIKGIRWMNNDLVNLITTLAGALAGGGLYVFMN